MSFHSLLVNIWRDFLTYILEKRLSQSRHSLHSRMKQEEKKRRFSRLRSGNGDKWFHSWGAVPLLSPRNAFEADQEIGIRFFFTKLKVCRDRLTVFFTRNSPVFLDQQKSCSPKFKVIFFALITLFTCFWSQFFAFTDCFSHGNSLFVTIFKFCRDFKVENLVFFILRTAPRSKISWDLFLLVCFLIGWMREREVLWTMMPGTNRSWIPHSTFSLF